MGAALLLLVAGGASPARAEGPTFLETYEKAQALYRDGAYEKALRLYERAYALSPAPEVSYGIARCHHQLGHYGEAVEAYERFLVASPGHAGALKARTFLVEALVAHGGAEIGARNYGSARAAYERALEIHSAASPGGTDAVTGNILIGLAEALLELGDRRGARERLDRASKTELTSPMRARLKTLTARASASGAEEKKKKRPSLMPDEAPGDTDGAAATAPEPVAKKSRVGLWLGIGGGVVGVVVLATVITVVATRPPRPDLGWVEFDFQG